MLPGFGVGGHCLTKDPLFANISSKYVFEFKDQKFDLLKHAVNTNKEMPLNTFKLIKSKFKKNTSKKILIMGVSYKEDIDDTRNSPSALLYNKLKKHFKHIDFCDPLVKKWEELNLELKNEVPDLNKYDILVLVNKNYQNLNFEKILKQKKISIFDTNNILTTKKIKKFLKKGVKVFSIGK
jgi:UDP-N-acetyl-D-mannosaminuronate dehydrogenase